jgi:hypothetical protein
MLAAIQFDNQPSVGAKEINDVGPNWDLPAPFPAGQATIAQLAP